MKRAYKHISGFLLAGLLIVALTGNADAQRGRGGFHGGGGLHVGIGIGGPGFGLGYYRYSYPAVGFYLNALPYGYYPFFWGPDQYYYYGGTFYRPYNNGYQIAAPPIGATVPQIPKNVHPILIDGQQYYELKGVYYKEGVDDKGNKVYIVAGKDGVLNTDNAQQAADQRPPQVGDMVEQLPDGCNKVTLNGKRYFVSPDGIYFEEIKDPNDPKKISYRIASVPEDNQQPQQNQQQQNQQ